MTEKDAVKCRAFGSETHWVLPVDAFIDERFGAFVETRLQTWRPPAR
jgi:tetraacyldisaccharide-1-P 4'-kinase